MGIGNRIAKKRIRGSRQQKTVNGSQVDVDSTQRTYAADRLSLLQRATLYVMLRDIYNTMNG